MVTLFDSLDIEVVWLIQLLVTLFGAVLFMQSGFDKIKHWHARELQLRALYEATPLAPWTQFLYPLIMVLELGTGIAATYGVIMLLTGVNTTSFLAMLMCTITTLLQFSGHRIAKNEAGAALRVPYFLVFIFGLYLFYR
jgi:uncharacterized membrane protein YphA (DoxX/SURF4 family)